ncbi:hypothetical protein [Neobacillus niacini]|uniref:hypothetical protein n=1 Tax=Neobacillus niacini TaxID=86668 RepID=UPI0021CB3963|nr:hypothetical protein [Neobacillus niacini]MCM3767310.1 hypothetical protein [Neobacillus niacini]
MDKSRQRRVNNIAQQRNNFENRTTQRQLSENNNRALSRVFDQDKISNEILNSINKSGNSDVDVRVDVHVDTTPIAFAILCSLLATKQMNNDEFEEAVERLRNLNLTEDYTTNNVYNPIKMYKRTRKKVD